MFSDSITPGAHIDQLIDTAHRARAKLPVARHCRTTSGNSRPHSHTHTHHCGFADSPQLHLSCPVSTHTLSLSHTLSPPLLTNSARASSQVMRPLPPPGQITHMAIHCNHRDCSTLWFPVVGLWDGKASPRGWSCHSDGSSRFHSHFHFRLSSGKLTAREATPKTKIS